MRLPDAGKIHFSQRATVVSVIPDGDLKSSESYFRLARTRIVEREPTC
jgi:hypothetical protein